MPINFSELVDKIDQRNRQNREQAWGQIAPFLDVMTRKATYEYEKQKAKDETAAGLKVAGDAMGMKDYAADTSLTPDMQKFIFNIDAERQAPDKEWEAFSSVYGVPKPDNFDNMTPQQKTVSLGRAKEDKKTIDGVNATLAAYPEAAEEVYKHPKFADGNAQVKEAIAQRALSKVLGNEKAKSELSANIEKSEINIAEYWATTGSMQQQKLDAAGQSQPKLNQGQKDALNTMRLYEKEGIVKNGHKVKIEMQGDKFVATTIINGVKIKKTPSGYFYQDKSGDWRELSSKELGRDKYKDVSKALSNAMAEYDTKRIKLPDREVKPAATATNPDFDDIFK